MDQKTFWKSKLEITDEIETIYLEIDNVGERLKKLDLIGNPNVYFNGECECYE